MKPAAKWFASCPKGLEYLLVDELIALGVERATAAHSGVNVEGSVEQALRAVLWSRLASRVLWPIAKFACADDGELYQNAHEIAWEDHLNADGSLWIDAHLSHSAITHERYAAQRLKDAIADRLRAKFGVRPNVDAELPDLRIHLLVRKGEATISIDLGGALHRRGWRKAQGEAPMKENLAAAVLLRGGWPKAYAEGGGLLDPMCGSGTLLIEGALMAADVAPGLQRYGFDSPSQWKQFQRGIWDGLMQEAKQRAETGVAALRPVFFGSDSDSRVLSTAARNAVAAGVGDALRLTPQRVEDLQGDFGAQGVVVCNPPYDARLSADPALYRALGDALRRVVPEWNASLLCGDEALARATGLHAKKTYAVFNGALECCLLVVERLGVQRERKNKTDSVLSDGAVMVANRLRKNLRNSERWRKTQGVSCHRLYDADIPEYAAAVDLYEDAGTGAMHAHIQEYEAPKEIPEAVTRERFGELLAGVRDALALPPERMAVKTRRRGKGGSKYGVMNRREEYFSVREGEALLYVNLHDYLDTGLFLDHRPLRRRVFAEAEGRRVLNLFCYTGAISVQAALGGASSTTSVDLSPTYLQWAGENFALNGLGGGRHRLVQADVMRWLEGERSEYDLIICDPPTFSNSARAEDFDLQREHVKLLTLCIQRLSRDGVLYFSNNFRRFKLDAEALADIAMIEDISASSIDQDFSRNPKIHRAWKLTRR